MSDKRVGLAEAVPDRVELLDYVGRPIDLPEGSFVGIAAGEMVERARRLEYDVFRRQGYCEPTKDGRIDEYRNWDNISKFHVVVMPDGELIATVRTTAGPYESLPVGKFPRWRRYPSGPVVEYASLVVAPGSRGAGGAEALYRSVVHEAVAGGFDGIVAIGEQWLLDLLNTAYDSGFRQLGLSRWYMGGECFPMGTSMKDLWDHFRVRQPTFYRWFMEGIHEIDLRDSSGDIDLSASPMPALVG